MGGFAKKFLTKEGVKLVDVRVIGKTQIYNEFDEVENDYWFNFKQKKFLHNKNNSVCLSEHEIYDMIFIIG